MSIPLFVQLLIKQKRKIKRAFIKSRNPFIKSALNAISKKIKKKQIKSRRNADIQNIIQNLQRTNDPKSCRTLKKEIPHFPSKESSYPDLKSDSSIVKTDPNKLKQLAEQLKSVFATKIELKDNNLEREIGNFNNLKYSLNFQRPTVSWKLFSGRSINTVRQRMRQVSLNMGVL